MNPSFWQGRRVFITGHTGFKGSWLALWLTKLGARVTGYSLLPPSNPSLFEVARVGEGMDTVIADIRDLEHLSAEMQRAAPEIVIHMAAQSLVRYSYANPVETYAANVMGTVNLLEAVRQTGSVRAVVNITSDKCYENREWLWGYRENEPMGGHDPYSSSKGCAELVTAAYRNSFFNPNAYAHHGVAIASVRAGNVIGGGDWALDRLIPDMVRAFSDQKPVTIRSPNAIRPWQHVLEPLAGYLTLAEALVENGPVYCEGWNFGPADDDVKPVQWIVERLVEQWGSGASWVLDASPQLHEATHLKLDCSKAHARLNWRPRWSLEQALQHIVDWHQTYLQCADMREFSLQQIEYYQRHKISM